MLAIFPILSVDAFELPDAEKKSSPSAVRFYLKARGAFGKGEERSDGFIVFEGSKARAG